MNKVILIEKPKPSIDIKKASSFGEFVYLFNGKDRRCSAFDTIKYQREMLRRLKAAEYDPENDYICVAGSVLILAICLVAISQVYDRFKVLLFSSTESRYVERVFDNNYVS